MRLIVSDFVGCPETAERTNNGNNDGQESAMAKGTGCFLLCFSVRAAKKLLLGYSEIGLMIMVLSRLGMKHSPAM